MTNTYYRLERLKASATKRGKTWQQQWKDTSYRRFSIGGGTWQRLENMPKFASSSDRAFYLDTFDNFRNVQDAHEATRSIQHTGWYCDEFQDSLSIGVVMQLPSRDGKELWIPGHRETGSDGVTCYPLDWYDDKEECARAADTFAERYAEREREYQVLESAKMRVEEHRNTISDARKDRRTLVVAIREARLHAEGMSKQAVTTICASLRSQIHQLKAQSIEAYEAISKLESEFGSEVLS